MIFNTADSDDPKRPSKAEPDPNETRPMSPDELRDFEKSIVQGEGERPEDTATPLRPPLTPW